MRWQSSHSPTLPLCNDSVPPSALIDWRSSSARSRFQVSGRDHCAFRREAVADRRADPNVLPVTNADPAGEITVTVCALGLRLVVAIVCPFGSLVQLLDDHRLPHPTGDAHRRAPNLPSTSSRLLSRVVMIGALVIPNG